MKNYSQTNSLLCVLIILSTVLLLSCTSADDKTTDTENKVERSDTAYLVQSYTDTDDLTQAAVAIDEQEVAPQIEVTTSTKPVADNTAIAPKPSPTKPAAVTEKPAVILPPAEVPVVAPAATPLIPKAEPASAPAPASVPLPAAPIAKQVGFTLKSTKAIIKGSSSLHAWESNITQIQGKGSFETKDEKLVALKDVEIKMAVTGIKSKEGSRMDNKTYETFKSDQHPSIIYKFSNAVVNVNASNAVTVEAPGNLPWREAHDLYRLQQPENYCPTAIYI